MTYRVVYGETMPAWERTFSTLRDAKTFAKQHESFGDIIFSIGKAVPGEAPQSLMAALGMAPIDERPRDYKGRLVRRRGRGLA